MNRRKFLTTTSGSLALGQFLSAKPQSFTGKIKKAVKFGAKPNDQKMQGRILFGWTFTIVGTVLFGVGFKNNESLLIMLNGLILILTLRTQMEAVLQ